MEFARGQILVGILIVVALSGRVTGYQYVGGTSYTGQRSNNWNSPVTWTNGPGEFPNGPGDIAETAGFVRGDVDLYLNQDITLGTFNWAGTGLGVYGGTPKGGFIVANNGTPSTWKLELTGWVWFDAGLTLSNDLRLVITNSAGFGDDRGPYARLGGNVAGPGKLILECATPYLNTFQLGMGGGASNSHTGGTRLIGHPSGLVYFEPVKAGFFGSGDLELAYGARLVLRKRAFATNYIADSAAVLVETLHASNWPRIYIEAGLDERVRALYIDGVQQPAGVYGSLEGPASERLPELFVGGGTLTVLTGPPNPGAIRNLPPIEVIGSAVTIGGELVETNASPTEVYLYWGEKDGGMQPSAWDHCESLGVRGPGQFHVTISGYVPGTTIFYRCFMTNALGSKWAWATAKLCPPRVRNELPLVKAGVTTLRGTLLTTNGPPTPLKVYWGRTDGGTNPAAWEHVAELGFATGGMLATNVPGLLPDAQYYFRVYGTNLVGEHWAEQSGTFSTSVTPVWGEVTFLVASDLHYGASWHVPTADELAKTVIENMNALPGQTYPVEVGGGVIPRPRGVLLVGDITEGRTAEQWMAFTNDWGLVGERLLAFPVYGGFGNHDAGTPYGLVPDGIKARTAQRPGIRHISPDGYHYSFDWDFLHLVCLNAFPGNEVHSGYPGPDPSNSLDFLVRDLERYVGPSGRPVVIYHHYGFDSYGASMWSDAQRTNYFNVIKDYNVVAIFNGHTHTVGQVRWCGFDAFLDGTVGKFIGNFLLVRVTRTNLVVLERTRSNTWGRIFTKTISVPNTMFVWNGDGATNVGYDSAELTGRFLMNGQPPVHLRIFWGPADGGTNRDAWAHMIELGELPLGPFSVVITGLVHGTTYFYRCHASNAVGEAWAPTSGSFTTLASNTPPVLEPVPDQYVEAGNTLVVTNVANDPECPPQILSFQLLVAPPGAEMEPTTGVLRWQSAATYIGTTNGIVLMVADNGFPPMTATQSFHVIVLPPTRPLLEAPMLTNATCTIKAWAALPGMYTMEASTNLRDWFTLFTNPGPLLPLYWIDTNALAHPIRFYRIMSIH